MTTPPDFTVLLLAWDQADPSVAVLGGAALPPTLPLVYRLATGQAVLAVYPHLPGEAEHEALAGPTPPAHASEAAPSQAAPGTTQPLAGVLELPQQGTAAENPAPFSRIVGLLDLTPGGSVRLQAALPPSPGPARLPAAASRSQWPTGVHAPQAQSGQAPAAPYAGASAEAAAEPPSAPAAAPVLQVPVPPTRPSPNVREAADLALAALTAQVAPAPDRALRTAANPQAGDLNVGPGPELPFIQRAAAFSEPVEEIGAAEAADLLAPEDLTPDEFEPAPAAEAAPAPAPEPAAAPGGPALLLPSLNGLNFRMIQYARQAAQLVRDRADFEVIYAPNWPAWLAALELRNSTGRPLVLYAASLAADFTSPAERGWLLEVERMTLRRAHLVLVPDADVHQRLQAQYGTTIGEIRVVPAADEQAVREALRTAAVR